MDITLVYLALAIIFAFLMAWGVGANDVANAMGTSVGSGAVSLKHAIIIATIFEFLGAFLGGGEVTDTIRRGILDTSDLAHTPHLYIEGMLASLLAAAVWLMSASRYGWPVSTSHTIVGAIVGFGTVVVGPHAIQWGTLGSIAMSWVVSPLMGLILGYSIYWTVQTWIINQAQPLMWAKRLVPVYIFIVGWVVAAFTLVSGLQHIGIVLSPMLSLNISLMFGLFTSLIGVHFLGKMKFDPKADKDFHYTNVERIFGLLMVFTACSMAYAHGSNDVANAIGPLAAIAQVAATGDVMQSGPIPLWVLGLGSGGIVVGLVTYGHRVIATIGSGITELTPSKGFAATLAAAVTVVTASGSGLPISTTHTLVGAILGVGLAKGISAINLTVVRAIFMSWLVTLPAGAVLSITFFKILDSIF